MGREQFNFQKAAIKAERLAQSNIFLYKMQLVFYALLGYGVIFVVLISLFGLLGGMIGMAFMSTALFLLLIKKKLIFIILPTIWILLKSLWVRFKSPTGYCLTRQKFPLLFKPKESPKIHQVILIPELNAAIIQTPRLGILGWYKNSLILGLELLLILSPDQARAVLAHEFGHLSGNHSRFGRWIYRLRLTWYRIMQAFEQEETIGAKMMRRFFNWYAPRFAAYSFALARLNEYEADMISAELTSNDLAGYALVNTHVTGPYIEQHYWREFFHQADETPVPKTAPWRGLSHFLHEHQPAMKQLTAKLNEELQRQTAYEDTHPALQDRIKALKISASIPKPVKVTAAEVWFGEQFQRVIDDFDEDWWQCNDTPWKERYDYVAANKKVLAELNSKTVAALTDEELWKQAVLTEQFEPEGDALSLFQAYQSRHPNDPSVAFILGKIFYDNNDEKCLEQLKQALIHPKLVIDACQYAYSFLINQDRNEEAQWWLQRSQTQLQINEASRYERSWLTAEDTLLKADINNQELEQIVARLKTYNIKKAWIARKQIQYYTEVPAFAIAIILIGWFTNYEKMTDTIANDLTNNLDLNCSLFVVPKAGDYKKLAKKIIQIGDRIL